MIRTAIAFAAAVVLLVGSWPGEADAHSKKRFGYGSYSPGVYSPGISFYLGPYQRYGNYPYYFPYYPRNPFYRYDSSYGGPSRCGTWSDRCARNWGAGGPNYRGCLRHHGC